MRPKHTGPGYTDPMRRLFGNTAPGVPSAGPACAARVILRPPAVRGVLNHAVLGDFHTEYNITLLPYSNLSEGYKIMERQE